MKNETKVINKINELATAGKSKSDIIAFVSISFDLTKSEVQSKVEEMGIVITRGETKSGALREWFLSHESPLNITKSDIKAKCIELEMKGGSITYYVNAYSLAIELHSQLS